MKLKIGILLRTAAFVGFLLGGCPSLVLAVVSGHTMTEFTSVPINLTDNDVTPLVMINSSNDHQLYFKAYNDYTDLDGDGTPETTYKHSINYYGYFDSYKCYEYSAGNQRFEPKAETADKYCTGGNDAYWSGNFLNWATMSRIDAIRKILFGGHRRVDTAAGTVLERSYLPSDIHSFAKHYDGSDLAKLIPYAANTSAPTSTSVTNNTVSSPATSSTSVNIGNGNKTFTVNAASLINVGDYVIAQVASDPSSFMAGNATAVVGASVTINVVSKGGAGNYANWKLIPRKEFWAAGGTWANGDYVRAAVTGDPAKYQEGYIVASGLDIFIYVTNAVNSGNTNYAAWTLTNLTRTGITLCNTTWNASDYSGNVTDPPLIRVAAGNYAFWAAGEVVQCGWDDVSGSADYGKNYNNPVTSGIYAAQDNPSYAAVGLGDLVARVQACVPGLLGQEKCKLYPGVDGVAGNGDDNYKPIGLLQTYGDTDQLHFGMISGTYGKHKSGGDMITNIGSMSREINVGTTGTFKTVSTTAGGTANPNNASEGLINAWSLYRIYGYKHGDWNYTKSAAGGDNCEVDYFVTEQNSKCTNWGNPMAEIFQTSVFYFIGENAPQDYQSNDTSYLSGLRYTPGGWVDPLTSSNYCAALSILNFNSSVVSVDSDELDTAQYGFEKDLGSPLTSTHLTNIVGKGEQIHGKKFFVGEVSGSTNQQCTEKTVTALGEVLGMCPEGADLKGSYRIAGLAYYAHVNDIRPEVLPNSGQQNNRKLTGTQKIESYAVAFSSGAPVIEIPIPNNPGQKVKILPACINNNRSNHSCTLVDFKIVRPHQETAPGSGIYTGKFLAIWEDSLQGNDYDLDAGGTYEYTITNATINITTAVTLESLSHAIGHGYVLSGTTKDGLHIHSGTNSFDYADPTGMTGCVDCYGPQDGGGASTTNSYTLGSSGTELLNDPLWYAAKWGGFRNQNGDTLEYNGQMYPEPDIQSEWDRVINATGVTGADGIPDNYFYASNPAELEDALNRVFLNILQRTSSGTAAAVVSNNVSGVGALYQAYYEPLRQDALGNEATWLGTVQALWLDSYGYIREDSGIAAKLEDYHTDKVIQFFYDEGENKTRVRRYTSTKADEFSPYSMQGTVDTYDQGTGIVTFTVAESSGAVGSGPFNEWTVYNLTTGQTGTSVSSVSMVAGGALIFAVSPASNWISPGNTLMVAHFEYTTAELAEIGTLWNGRKQLSFTGADAASQRTFTVQADGAVNGGRFVKTWIDTDGDSVVDVGEFVDFAASSVSPANFGFFDLATEAEAESLVDYIRGKEVAGYRNRTVDYDGDQIPEVVRLADIVNSTPTVVGSPQEGFDLLYKDATYVTFKKQYAKRRQVLYVGSNGGMLHAFNGGFYDTATLSFLTTGKKYDGITDVVAHPLGSELWAYVPMNLLPHLKWLKDNNYSHVYYMDGKPKVFDAKIFTADADHPGGWGTVLVVGMRFGGGPMTVNPGAGNRSFRSAYVLMDITNPENEPRLLAELQVPDGSYSTSYSAVATVKDKDPALDQNKWYLLFGSGPENLTEAKSTTNAKIYAFDLGEVATPGSSAVAGVLPANCSQLAVGTGGSMKILSCDTLVANSFVGDPISVDWDLNYKAETIYFGLVGDKNATSGGVMRLGINEQSDPTLWSSPSTLINTSQPVVAGVTPGKDETGQKWIYFGTGRFFVSGDQASTATQSIYGVKEAGAEVVKNDINLLNVSSAQVATDGALTGVGAIATFDDLESTVAASYKGWYLNLPPIQGAAGSAPATRVISQAALAGGVLFTTVYQPGVDACSGEGFSRLYGLYYKTGTAYPSPTVFGSEVIGAVEYSRSYIELGTGFATAPSIHTGSGTGDNAVSVFTQLSTGTIVRTEASTVTGVRSKMESWIELR